MAVGALHLRVLRGEESCGTCRTAPAVVVLPRYDGEPHSIKVEDLYRALCRPCASQYVRQPLRFRLQQVAQWRDEIRAGK